MSCVKKVFSKFCRIYSKTTGMAFFFSKVTDLGLCLQNRKTTMPKSLFNKIAGWRPAALFKKRL